MSQEKFDAIDTDNDGFITASELSASITDASGVSQENIDAIVAMADDNGDQQISFEEYERLLG